ncbi:Peroxiredoxin [Sphingobium herbicidovorans NBRC 16415]|uniref:Peroxiredoxin n=1 Tax=Sphingobium herbicidovorans (strain ATCC 700291 / DSM 11019 / CCUG 56400 / KCTC 2939 / LMG 18315 / NBRC 16415 / MH) TaxID=1219045 RepID=A0A086PAR5_SPHHM|nr:DsrE family protein [Sphingobium herbicidovorans]KFG90483.1 Peroxiredoxin [Sphingobium herbicidovorans NBRC 16415]
MRELRIIVATADAERLRGALVLASAQAALGGAASLFLQLDGVALLAPAVEAPRDAAHRSAGLPTLGQLITEARALGVAILACQSGMALHGLAERDLPQGVTASGPIAFLQETGDEARLIFA